MTHALDERKRWLALIVLCLGVLMIVLDTTIVNVALPSIRADLGFTETSLVWVVNAYMLTFGGFLLLGGRLGDLFGHRKLFLLGITLFTLASAACGLANSQALLISARAVQGLGGAVVSAVSLSLIMNLFTSPADRARAMGIYGFVGGGGGSVGVLLGGVLTSALSWSGRKLCAPSLIALSGLGCISINKPSAPAATAASAIGGTKSRIPTPCEGSPKTGRCVSFFSTGIAEMSIVLRVYVSYVRMPRSQSIRS